MKTALLAASLTIGLPWLAQAQAQAQAQVPAQAPAPAPALAQDIPPALLGTYAAGAGGCGAAETVLHVTSRSLVTWQAGGEARLIRVATAQPASGWLIATGTGDAAPRVLLRESGAGQVGIDRVVPTEKTRDDQLPGAAPSLHLARCQSLPTRFTALHGEGLAFLHGLETMEAACGGTAVKACGDAILAYADVTHDGRLTVAELARLFRGAAWVMQMAGGTTDGELGLGVVAATAAGLAAAEVIVRSYDYDGTASISLDELMQDRLVMEVSPSARPAAANPLPLDQVVPGARMLRELLRGLGG